MKSRLKQTLRAIRHRWKPDPFVARRVLLTGAAGKIGRPVGAELARRGHWVRALDRTPAPPDSHHPQWMTGNICDPAILDAAMIDIDVAVHLAGALDDRPFEPDLIETNVRGIYRVFESARIHGVKRLIIATSPNAQFWHAVGRKRPVQIDDSFAPLDIYSVTKIFAEQMGWMYGNHHGLPTIAIRFGWLPHNPENQRKLDDNPDHHDWYVSPGDAARGAALAVEAPAYRVGKFAAVNIFSKPRGAGPFDLRPARKLLGFVPRNQYVPKS